MSADRTPATHVYAFIGDDSFSRAQKIATWTTAFRKKHGDQGIHVLDCSSSTTTAEEIKTTLRGSGLFQTTTLVIINNLWSAKRADLLDTVTAHIPTLPASHFLVLADSPLDGRSQHAKTLQRMVQEGILVREDFPLPKGPALTAWIRTRVTHLGGTFDPKDAARICALYVAPPSMDESGDESIDLWYLDAELRKLIAYTAGRPITIRDVGALGCVPSWAHLFQFSDALLERNYPDALRLAHRAKTPLLSMVAFLLSQFHSFIMVKNMEEEGLREQDIAQHLAWNPKRVWVVSKKIRTIPCATLCACMKKILAFEQRLKTGAGDPLLHLDLLIRFLTTTLAAKHA